MSPSNWSFVAFVLGICGYLPYNLAIFQRKTKPRLSSWIIWVFLDWASFAGMLMKGEVNGVVFAFSLGATFTLLNAWLHSVGDCGWGWIDTTCSVVGVASAILWLFDADPTRALILMGVGLVAGNIPTYRHVLWRPEDENLLGWGISVSASTAGLLAVTEWTVAKATTPVIFAGSGYTILLCLLIGYARKRPS